MLRTAVKLTGGGVTAISAASYAWAVNSMGSDAVSRIIEYDLVAAPAIMDYKW
jgi:hypothetical protein